MQIIVTFHRGQGAAISSGVRRIDRVFYDCSNTSENITRFLTQLKQNYKTIVMNVPCGFNGALFDSFKQFIQLFHQNVSTFEIFVRGIPSTMRLQNGEVLANPLFRTPTGFTVNSNSTAVNKLLKDFKTNCHQSPNINTFVIHILMQMGFIMLDNGNPDSCGSASRYAYTTKEINFTQIKSKGAPFTCPFDQRNTMNDWQSWKAHWYSQHHDRYFSARLQTSSTNDNCTYDDKQSYQSVFEFLNSKPLFDLLNMATTVRILSIMLDYRFNFSNVESFLDKLSNYFNNVETVRITVIKSHKRDENDLKLFYKTYFGGIIITCIKKFNTIQRIEMVWDKAKPMGGTNGSQSFITVDMNKDHDPPDMKIKRHVDTIVDNLCQYRFLNGFQDMDVIELETNHQL